MKGTLSQTSAVLEAWYPGAEGGTAIARLLYGNVSPSGRLPMTFPASADQLAHPDIAGVTGTSVFEVQFHTDQELVYKEGADVGYRWFDKQHETPLFSFGYGQTYTRFALDGLVVAPTSSGRGQGAVATFDVKNIGARVGTVIPQIYVELPEGGARKLAGWARLTLSPGESRHVSVDLEPRILARFDSTKDRWDVSGGAYRVWLADSAADSSHNITVKLPSWTIAP